MCVSLQLHGGLKKMAKFSKNPEKMAKSVIMQLHNTEAEDIRGEATGQSELASVRTTASFLAALKEVATYAISQQCTLRDLTPAQAKDYLSQRGEVIGQKSLDLEKHAITKMLIHVTGKLEKGDNLGPIKSERQQVLVSRAYAKEQISEISKCQTERNALATELSYSSGLRAHEMFTLRPISEQPVTTKAVTSQHKFLGREGKIYSCVGKSGLCRAILIPEILVERLENLRLQTPQITVDRTVRYEQHYAINGGNRWSSSFTTASNRALEYSTGAHSCRHSYAQERMQELQKSGLTFREGLLAVSNELGHYRESITLTYLR